MTRRTITDDEWALLTPYGPMRHKATGKSYQQLFSEGERRIKQILRAGNKKRKDQATSG